MPGTRTEDLAADYFAAERLRKLAEAGEFIIASVSQLAYGLIVHLIVMPGAAALRLGLSVCKELSAIAAHVFRAAALLVERRL